MSRQVIYFPNLFKISQSLPIRLNPNYLNVMKDAREWITKYDEKSLVQRDNSELFCAYIATTLSAERLRVLCDYVNLFFLVDDLIDEYGNQGRNPKEVLTNVFDAFKNIDGEVNSLVGKGYQDLLKRLRRILSKDSFKNTCNTVIEHSKAELKAIDREGYYDLKTYMDERAIQIGAKLILGLTEELENFALFEEIKKDDDFQLMKETIYRLLFITNDVYSFAKEHRVGKTKDNIITVLRAIKDSSMQEAFDMSGEIYEEHFNVYLSVKKKLLEKYKNHAKFGEIKRYLQHGEDFVMGNMMWSATTYRYLTHHDDFIFMPPKPVLYYKN